jgi:hypothetical protein
MNGYLGTQILCIRDIRLGSGTRQACCPMATGDSSVWLRRFGQGARGSVVVKALC